MKTFVYIVGRARKPDTFKVGFTNNPPRRLDQLKRKAGDPSLKFWYIAEAPYGIHASLVERQVHKALLPHRAHGEWFWLPLARIRTTLIAAVQQVTKADPGSMAPLPYRDHHGERAYREAKDNWLEIGGRSDSKPALPPLKRVSQTRRITSQI